MLDRIVGYKLSPLLWRKVRKGLSAGRVQSVTVKIICDREKEVQSFVSEEYWTVGLKLRKDKLPLFEAELSTVDGKKLEVHNKDAADQLVADLEKQAFSVQEVKKRQRQRKAAAPFTTSSMQQDAARKLGFTSRKTMMLAQQLYEGIDLGRKGPVGLITYMRTDSTRISELAQQEARGFVEQKYGKDYIPEKPNVYAAGKKAQDAHGAGQRGLGVVILHDALLAAQTLLGTLPRLFRAAEVDLLRTLCSNNQHDHIISGNLGKAAGFGGAVPFSVDLVFQYARLQGNRCVFVARKHLIQTILYGENQRFSLSDVELPIGS